MNGAAIAFRMQFLSDNAAAVHPQVWRALQAADSADTPYDTERDGYVVDFDKERLENAPSFPEGQQPDYDRSYGETVYTYYGVIY